MYLGENSLSNVVIPHPYAKIVGLSGWSQPTGSIKDIAANAMLRHAHLQPGQQVIEATSGNTGIALAALCAQRDFPCTIVMPENMSKERIALLQFYGAQVILTSQREGMAGAQRLARYLAEDAGACFIDQFQNPANVQAHYDGTGPMIAAGSMPDLLVCGVGTGGTITGTGKYLKERKPDIQIVGVTPHKNHVIPGIGAGCPLPLLQDGLVDEWITATREDALMTAKKSHLGCGFSSGAALFAAQILANRPENEGKSIAVVLPDSIDRYLSELS